MYKVYTTKEFDKKRLKVDFSVRKQIEDCIEKISDNPFVGKPLNYKFIREKKINNYRIYYIVYYMNNSVLMVSLSQKKNQQRTINKIKSLLKNYKNFVTENIK
jgi:mRNA-degrading endonuclease RelE of RelBE toxin-antitoxin system